jgi:hypothetical protein
MYDILYEIHFIEYKTFSVIIGMRRFAFQM